MLVTVLSLCIGIHRLVRFHPPVPSPHLILSLRLSETPFFFSSCLDPPYLDNLQTTSICLPREPQCHIRPIWSSLSRCSELPSATCAYRRWRLRYASTFIVLPVNSLYLVPELVLDPSLPTRPVRHCQSSPCRRRAN